MNHQTLQYRTFVSLLIAVSLGLLWVVWPFIGAVFWGAILAIIFVPLHRRMLRSFGHRRNLAALATLLVVLLLVILPAALIAGALVQEGTQVYARIRSGEIDFGAYFQQIYEALPGPAHALLERFGVTDLPTMQQELSALAAQGSQFIAAQALSIGQNTAQFLVSFGVMLYLLFFLFRDGAGLSRRIKDAVPLSEEHKRHLFRKFTTVVRATVKGNVVVAVTQGALGGLIFWIMGIQGALLWSVLMAFLSLLPAVGAGLIWGPVAIYFLATGELVQGLVLIAYGVLVIGLVDNILRPILVGKDTQMPDYLVLITTLGGMTIFGLTGFVVGPLVAALFMAIWDLFATMNESTE
ncbi:AI-2E family transporter [Orrella sp. JC864]|uniref:AI-2E family transporter n=1 Tax=Orrella sp. JC864 TaxID=3120298 RepID=UPI0012BC924B